MGEIEDTLRETIRLQRDFVRELRRDNDPRLGKQMATLTRLLQEARRQGQETFTPQDDEEPVTRVDEIWREKPVPMREFILSDKYLGMTGHIFENILRVALEWDRPHIREGWLVAGKGSGKDFLVATMLCRSIYVMLCYYNWRDYFNLRIGDIYALNVSTNQIQAQKVLFTYLTSMIKQSPWFDGKFGETKSEIEFERGIHAIAGHSKSTAWEGYSYFAAALDEVDFFRNAEGKSVAEDLYGTAKEGAKTRFPDDYKLFMISALGGYKSLCHQKMEEMELEGKPRPEVLTHVRDSEDKFAYGTWEADNTMLTVAPTWVMHSRQTFQQYKRELMKNPVRAGMRYGCKVSAGEQAFIGQPELFEAKFNRSRKHPVQDDLRLQPWFKPRFVDYFVHCDLSAKRDSTGIAMSHYEDRRDMMVVDLMLQIQVPKGGQLLISNARRFILGLAKRGFSIYKVTFDRWQSLDTIQQLRNQGIQAELYSVQIEAYDTFLDLLDGDKLDLYPYVPFIDEMKTLRSDGRKVDHPVGGSDDISQAVVASIFQCLKRTSR